MQDEFVVAPLNITHVPLYDGDILFISGATASNTVQWEVLDNILGVEILTPYDLEPTIKFNRDYGGDFLRLKISLLYAPEIFDVITIDTVPASVAYLYGYTTTEKLSVTEFNDSKVDVTNLIPIPNFSNDGVEISNLILYRWNHPPFHNIWAASSYTVQEKQPDFSWQDIGTTQNPEFVFEVGKNYRILTNYNNQLQSVPSDEIKIDNPPVLGSSILANYSANTTEKAIAPLSTPPTLFYTFFNDVIENDSLNNEGKQYTYSTKSISVTSNPPLLFFTFNNSESIDDGLSHEGKQYTTASKAIAPVSTPPTLFFTV